MSALGFLAVSSMLAGGLPAFPRGRRRRLRMPDAMRETAADAKRARKAAKREEDAAKSALGRRIWKKRPYPFPPMGFWDWWEQDPGPPVPRWQARLNHRRSLPWHGWLWLDSHAQWLRLFTPRSFMTKAWRSMKRIRAAAAMRKELSR